VSDSGGESYFMAYFVYILYSQSADKFYVGQTDNVTERLKSHQSAISRYTSGQAKDWDLVYQETLSTRTEGIRRELEIKKKKSRKYNE
jgi:putative endonuclease